VYGSRGWIGAMMVDALRRAGHLVVMGQARLNNIDDLFSELDMHKPDRVFSSTGRTHGTHSDGKVYTTIDYLELPGNLRVNTRDNLVGPLNLAHACKQRDIKMTYMGTGCIFVYDDEHRLPADAAVCGAAQIDCSDVKGFTEDDEPNFFGSGYSTVKGNTDTLLHQYSQHVLNLRIRMPISDGRNPRDFIRKITTYERICSIANSMTVLEEFLPIAVDMIASGETGTYNMCNPGVITHNQILDMYRERVDKTFTYRNFSEEEQAEILLSGRSNNYLDTSKLEKYCTERSLRLTGIYDAVGRVIDRLAARTDVSSK